MMTVKQKKVKPITKVTSDDIFQVYSGKPGCGCGCRGTYRVNPTHRQFADKVGGYAHDDKDMNLTSVKKVLAILQENWPRVEVTVGGVGDHAIVIYSLEDETHYRWVFTRQ